MAARDRFFGKIIVFGFLFLVSVCDAQGASRRIAKEHYKKIIAMRYSSLVARKALPKKPDFSRPRVRHVPKRHFGDAIFNLVTRVISDPTMRSVAEQGARMVVEHIPHIATTLVAIGVLNKERVRDAEMNKEHERYKQSLSSEQREAYSIVEETYNKALKSCDFPQDFGDSKTAEERAKFIARAVQQHNIDLGYDASYMPYNAPKVIYRGKEYAVATKTYAEWSKEEDRKYSSPSVEPKPLPRKNKGCGGDAGSSPTAVPTPVASPESKNKGCGGTVTPTPPILPNPATNHAGQPAQGCGGEVGQGPTADCAAVVKAPGIPDANSGFYPKKGWDGKSKTKHKPKNGPSMGEGYEDENGSIWIPTGPRGHGGPHWDVQHRGGGNDNYDNVYYGGNTRGGRMGTTKGGMLQPGRLKCDALPVEGEAAASVAPARHGVAQAAQNSANNGPVAEVSPARKASLIQAMTEFYRKRDTEKKLSKEQESTDKKNAAPAADVQKDQKPKDEKQSQAEAVPVVANPVRKQRERGSILRFFKRAPEDKETDTEKESVEKKEAKTAADIKEDLARRPSTVSPAPVVAPAQTPSPSAAPKKPRRTSILQSMKEPEKKETSTQEKAKATSPAPAAVAQPAEKKSILKSAKDFFTRKKESSKEQPAKDKAAAVADSSAGNAKAQAPESKGSELIIKLSPAMQSKLEQLARDKAAEHLRKKQEEEDAAARKRQEAILVELKRRQALFRSAAAADAQHSAAEAQKAQEPKNAKKQEDDARKRNGVTPNSPAQAPAAPSSSAAPEKTSMLLQAVKDFIKESVEKADNKETKEQKDQKDTKDAQPKETVKGENKESIKEMANKVALEKEAIMARERAQKAYAQQQEAQASRERNREIHDRAMAAMREQTAQKRDLQAERDEARRAESHRRFGIPYDGPCDAQCRDAKAREKFGLPPKEKPRLW